MLPHSLSSTGYITYYDTVFRNQCNTASEKAEAMAAVYKSLSKSDGQKAEPENNGLKRNKQRVLILSSRGVTYRLVPISLVKLLSSHGRRDY